MNGYSFNEKEELKKYKKTGSRKGFSNYCNWEEAVLENYQNITEPKYITNLKAKLKRECNLCDYNRKSLISIWIPLLTLVISLALALPSAFISLKQYQDSLQSDLDNTYLENMIRDGVQRDILIDNQVKLLQNRVDQSNESIDFVFDVFFLLYAIIIIVGCIFGLILREKLIKVAFYKDYITVLEKAIETKK